MQQGFSGSLVDSTSQAFEKIEYKFLAGEVELCSMQLRGPVIKPNIFQLEPVVPGVPSQLLDDSSAVARMLSIPCVQGTDEGFGVDGRHILYIDQVYDRQYVDVTGSYEAYLSKFKGKKLNSLKRKLKKVEKSNTERSSLRVFKNKSDVKEFVTVAKKISAVSYQELLLGTEFPCDDEWIVQLESKADEDRFRGYILYAENKPVAYNYCPIYGDGIMLYDLSGYVPDYQRYSPGTVLQANIIEQVFADESVRIYDLCQGEGRHKTLFSTGSIKCCNAFVFPRTIQNQLLVRAHWSLGRTTAAGVALSERFGLKDKVKTLIRRWRSSKQMYAAQTSVRS